MLLGVCSRTDQSHLCRHEGRGLAGLLDKRLNRAWRHKAPVDEVMRLVDVGHAKHFRVEHGCDEFANEHSHINGIESFRAYAKLRLSKSKGIHKPRFYYPLKETEFRFTHRRDNLYHVILKLLREKPI